MDDQLRKAVGRNLRQHREGLGLSQEGFAEMLGFHRNYIGGLERGELNLTLQTLETYAAMLQLDPRDLLRA